MAAVGAVEIIGVVSGLLGIMQWAQDNFKASPPENSANIRVTVGLDTPGGLSNSGGDAPDVRLFDENGDFLGMTADPGKVSSGGFKDITVDMKKSNRQPTYVLLSANDDAICLAFMSVTFPSGDKYGWTGDWGAQCGASWYYSNVYIDGTSTKPNCMWLDANGDQPQTGLQVHLPEFYVPNDGKSGIPAGRDVNYFCQQGPPFKYYKYPADKDPRGITYWVISNPQKRDEPREHARDLLSGLNTTVTAFAEGPAKEVTQKVEAGLNDLNNKILKTFAGHLVKDNATDHSTEDLCNSETSHGPDYLNHHDGRFCRMSDKKLFDLCPTGTTNATAVGSKSTCFDAESHMLLIGGIASRDDAPYHKVDTWGN